VGSVAYVAAGGQIQQIDSGGRLLFATDVGPTQSSPTVDDTRVYVGTNRGAVYAVHRRTGQSLWKWTGATNSILTAPAVGVGRVYVESSDNNVYGLAAATGGRIWTFTRPDGSLGYSGPVFLRDADPALASPSRIKGDALFVCGETTAYRLDPATGKEVWHAYVGGKSLATPAVGAGRIYVGGDGIGLTAFSAADGKPLWSFTGRADKDWFGAPLCAADGTVYVTTYNRYVYAVDGATGKQKWYYRLLGNALAAPALDPHGRTLYVTSGTFRDNPTLTALDARTGAKKWDARVGYVTGSPVVTAAGDRVYVAGTTTGYLYCYGVK
jgi:outer membrane protein assembly factor BamB